MTFTLYVPFPTRTPAVPYSKAVWIRVLGIDGLANKEPFLIRQYIGINVVQHGLDLWYGVLSLFVVIVDFLISSPRGVCPGYPHGLSDPHRGIRYLTPF
jgi:hypothetical protein